MAEYQAGHVSHAAGYEEAHMMNPVVACKRADFDPCIYKNTITKPECGDTHTSQATSPC